MYFGLIEERGKVYAGVKCGLVVIPVHTLNMWMREEGYYLVY